MKLTLQILIYLIFAISCTTATNGLKSDKTINKIFNKDEIKDLEILVNFFENQICLGQNIDLKNKQDCYESFFKHMVHCEEIGEVILNISFEAQKKIYDEISQSTFNQIWAIGKTWEHNSTDTLKYLFLNEKGKYIKFLKEFGTVNPFVEGYYDSFKLIGDISPSMFAGIIMRYKEFDISDAKFRLLLAIHYLTVNDDYERKEKY